jgi:hypothetical protein
MTSDEARELFGDAIDGTLAPDVQRSFEAAVAEDVELRDEWEAIRMVVRGAAQIGSAVSEADATPPPDFLPRVQSALRRRSRGRFYRDRFAQHAGPRAMLPLLVAILVALVVASAWVALQSMIVIESEDEETEPRSPTPRTEPR